MTIIVIDIVHYAIPFVLVTHSHMYVGKPCDATLRYLSIRWYVTTTSTIALDTCISESQCNTSQSISIYILK